VKISKELLAAFYGDLGRFFTHPDDIKYMRMLQQERQNAKTREAIGFPHLPIDYYDFLIERTASGTVGVTATPRRENVQKAMVTNLSRPSPLNAPPAGIPMGPPSNPPAPPAPSLADQLRTLSILRQGNKLILPEGMSYETVIEAMRMKIAEDEKPVDIVYDFDMTMPEGALALYRTLDDLYGFIQLKDTPGFFGPNPPTILTVQTGLGHTEMIPWGRFAVPGVEGYIETGIRWAGNIPYFQLSASIPAGSRAAIQQISDHMKARTDSIYKGHAIKVKFPPREKNTPVSDYFPKFLDLTNIDESKLVFSDDVQHIVDTTLFTPIKKTAFCRRHGISLKRGVLLEGPPGVGKTLTASVAATLAQQNGWTFIQADDVKDLSRVYRFAMRNQPAIISCEDLDQVLKDADERDDVINGILNSIDGIESKGLEIILVLTTNYVGRITKAALRPGRIDAVVPVRPPDAHAAQRLVRLYAGERMQSTEDLTVAGGLLAGKNAAVVREVVERSKLSALRWAENPDDDIQIRAIDIETAARGMEAHNQLLEPEEEDNRSDLEKAAEIVAEALATRPNGLSVDRDAVAKLLSEKHYVGAVPQG
jgi:transitional endoplasmic reticulum ATPase